MRLGEAMVGMGRGSLVARFGVYEADLRAGELRKHGLKLKLQEKPFQVLAILVQRPGEVVSRDELKQQLWPEDTFVDFDNSLNTAISKLREALSETAGNPRYIETLPKRGYRFIAPVTLLQNGRTHASEEVSGSSGAAPLDAPETADESEAVSIAPQEDLESAIAPVEEAAAPADEIPIAVPLIETASLTKQADRRAESSLRSRPSLKVGVAALLVLALLGIAVYTLRTITRGKGGKVMLVVLPFKNLNGDPDQEYFGEGLTEEMIAQLGRLQPDRLGVIARTSALRYKDTQKGITEIGRELGVEYVVEGSVRRANGRVRITVQLIQVSDQTHLWAESYDRDIADVLSIQKEVSERVASSLALELLPRHTDALRARATGNPAAHDLYLRGRYLWNKRTYPDILTSIGYFQKAIAEDPTYALAHSGLADAYIVLETYSQQPTSETRPLARAAALRAVQLAPDLPETRNSLAAIHHLEWNWPGAEREFKRAIELGPNYATARQWYAEFLAMRGRMGESLGEIRRARELDPLSVVINHVFGYNLYVARRYDEAVEQLKHTVELGPNYIMPHYALAYVYEQKGLYREAVLEWEVVLSRNPEASNAMMRAFEKGGYRAAMQQRLDSLTAMATTPDHHPSLVLARMCIITGRYDEAFRWLELAFEQKRQRLGYLKVDPVYDPIRDDPRYQDLTRRIGLD